MVRTALLAALSAAFALTICQPAWSQDSLDKAAGATREDFQQEVLMSADNVAYDKELGTIVATGNVEISQGERVLLADTVSYNQRNDVITASGDVTLLEPSGEVMFADYMELKDQLKDGVIRKLKVLLTDKSRLAAASARRTGGNRTEMRKAVYSPCELCPEHPERAPLWQLKAARVVHDQESHDIAYYDVWLELFGVPVAYTPYFEHPDPTVKRRSGFLAPIYGSSSTLGIELTTPYYWNIAPNRDATISPTFTSKEGIVLAGEYRERTETGGYQFSGSVTRTDRRNSEGEKIGGQEFRGHVFGHGEFQLDPEWRWGYELARASDPTYLSRYRIASESTLITRPYVEGFEGRGYTLGNAYFFQGLEPGDEQDRTPIILPLIDYKRLSEPDKIGSYWSLDANLLLLQRLEGADSRRVSLTGGWHLPYVAKSGEVYRVAATLRGDLYHVNNVEIPDNPGGETAHGLTGRIHPELLLEWRYPFINRGGSIRQIVEPIVQGIVSPYGGNPEKIPNEDSQDFEFDHTNLFSANRFTGLDRVEGGPRVNYGLVFGLYGENGGRATAVVGQSAHLKADNTFAEQSGLEDRLSDYVGRINISPAEYLDLSYRFRVAKTNLQVRRNEIDAAGGPEFLRINIGYAQLEEQIGEGNESVFANREEIAAAAVAKFLDYWSLSASGRRDLTGGGATINYGAGLNYEDECILFGFGFSRNFTRDRDVEPDTSYVVTIRFKNLG